MALTGSSPPEGPPRTSVPRISRRGSDAANPDQRRATIRRAEDRDYEAVCQLYGDLQYAHANNHPQIFAPPSQPELTKFEYRSIIRDMSVLALVAERDGEIIAAAQAGLASPAVEMRVRRIVHVTHLVTVPEARRQGHARALMDAVAAWARGMNADMIQLWVWEGNAEAESFYRAIGYRGTAKMLACLPQKQDGSARRADPDQRT